MSNHSHNNPDPSEYVPETYIPHAESHGTKALWRTFWILLFITVLDFGIYFMAPANMWRNIVFIGMGIVKAILIVGIFMHLSYERQFLRWMIVIPAIMFISYLVALLLFEGNMLSTY